MSDARTRILDRLRAGAPSPDGPPAVGLRTCDWDADERLARFARALAAVRGEIRRVGADWPRVLFERLRAAGVGNLLYGPDGPHGAALRQGWPDPAAIALRPYAESADGWRDDLFDGVQAGFSACRGAIAETGTLMLLSGRQTPATVSLLPETHIALVDVSRIVPTMEDAFALLRAECGSLPRAVNFISGPSRTGDIEQTIVLGAHGPCRVHLILIGADTTP